MNQGTGQRPWELELVKEMDEEELPFLKDWMEFWLILRETLCLEPEISWVGQPCRVFEQRQRE